MRAAPRKATPVAALCKALLIAASLSFAQISAVSAASDQPNDPPCRSEDAYCRGFVAGMLESLRIAGRVCVPEAVSTPRVEIIVRDWLALNPGLVMRGGAETISAALIKAFPCKPGGG